MFLPGQAMGRPMDIEQPFAQQLSSRAQGRTITDREAGSHASTIEGTRPRLQVAVQPPGDGRRPDPRLCARALGRTTRLLHPAPRRRRLRQRRPSRARGRRGLADPLAGRRPLALRLSAAGISVPPRSVHGATGAHLRRPALRGSAQGRTVDALGKAAAGAAGGAPQWFTTLEGGG